MEAKYKIYNPSGNITALVIGDKYTFEERKPSGEFLETLITIENNTITKAILKGNIKTDNKIRKIIIKE